MENKEDKNKPKSKRINYVTIPILLAVLVVAGWYLYSRHSNAKQYNRIISELVNQGKFEEAAKELEQLQKSAPSYLQPEIQENLVRCYLRIGRDPSLKMHDSIPWLKKAHALDPSILTSAERRIIAVPASAQFNDDTTDSKIPRDLRKHPEEPK